MEFTLLRTEIAGPLTEVKACVEIITTVDNGENSIDLHRELSELENLFFNTLHTKPKISQDMLGRLNAIQLCAFLVQRKHKDNSLIENCMIKLIASIQVMVAAIEQYRHELKLGLQLATGT